MRTAAILAVLIPLSGCLGNEQAEDVAADASVAAALGGPAPELADGFNNAFRDGDVYVAGAPKSEDALVAAKALGVNTVVDILTDEEHPRRVPFDEAAAAESLGLRYVRIPVTPATFSAGDVAAFDEAVRAAGGGKVLLHCASANRAGALYAAWLNRHQGEPAERALERGRAVGLRSDSMIEAAKRVLE